jgi:hypothetical protein
MRHALTASLLFATALALTATGHEPPAVYRERTVVESDYPFPFRAEFFRAQPPGGGDKKPDAAADKKAPDPTDAVIASALAADADVRMAKAKIQLAEAELAKARQAVTLKVVTLKAKIEQLKLTVSIAQERVDLLKHAFERATGSKADLIDAQNNLATAKAALSLAEAEWKLLTAPAAAADIVPDKTHVTALAWLAGQQTDAANDAILRYMYAADIARHQAVKGPVPDRIRTALDKPVKLAPKGQRVTLSQALEVFKKDAGMDVPVREQAGSNPIMSEGEELPVGAWFQLFADENREVRFLVREYGLLVALKSTAPPEAVNVVEFWKQKPPAKDTKPEPPK